MECDEAMKLEIGVATWLVATTSKCSSDMDNYVAPSIETSKTTLGILLGQDGFRHSLKFYGSLTDLLWLCSDTRITFDVTRHCW